MSSDEERPFKPMAPAELEAACAQVGIVPRGNPWDRPPYFADIDDVECWDTETGRPGIGLFAKAVQVWSLMQNRDTTVAAAALAFNVSERMIIEAVEWHPWMLLEGKDGDIIGHDGE